MCDDSKMSWINPQSNVVIYIKLKTQLIIYIKLIISACELTDDKMCIVTRNT